MDVEHTSIDLDLSRSADQGSKKGEMENCSENSKASLFCVPSFQITDLRHATTIVGAYKMKQPSTD